MNGPRREGQPGTPTLLARLVHDVGKYIARTAHNVVPGDWTPELAQLLCRDLFALAGGRASAVFAYLAGPLEQRTGPCPELTRARALLAEIDGLESAVRAADGAACAAAAERALAVERSLRDLLRNQQRDSP